MILKEGEILLGFGIDAYLWTIWREFVKLPPVKKVKNFLSSYFRGDAKL